GTIGQAPAPRTTGYDDSDRSTATCHRMQRLRVQLACIVTLALSGAAVPRSASAALSMRINRVGLFTDGSPLVREGEITFAEVALRNTGATPFDGLLRLTQLDRDGDVVISELPV